LHDFWYEVQKKAKKYARSNSLQGWNDVVVWRDFRRPYIPEDIWVQYIQHVTSERFTRHSKSDADNQNWKIHGLVTTHNGGSIPFTTHVKWMV
jgi:hypothetical protein